MSIIPATRPLTGEEWARSVEQRLKAFQNKSTVRIGQWVITEIGGNLTAVKPGDEFVVGEAEPTTVDLTGALRGFVTQDDLDESATQTQQNVFLALWEQLTGETDPGDDVLSQLANFLSGGLFGQIDISRLPSLLPLSRIRDIIQNLFLNGDFKTLDSIAPGVTDWLVDLADGAAPGLGSATTIADGATHILFSNNIDVDPDSVQTLNVSSFVKYLGLTSTGDAIKLQVSKYLGNTLVGTTLIDKLTAPNGTLGTWSTQLAGVFTTPGDGTIDNVTTELVVADSATAGTVKFSKAVSTFSDLMPQNYVDGLTSVLASIWSGIAARIADWQALLDAFNNGAGGILTDVEDRIKNLLPGSGLFNSAFLSNIANIPAGIPGGHVTGVASDMLTDFGTNLDNIVQKFLGVGNIGNTPADANTAFASLRDTVLGLSRDVQSLQQAANGAANSGQVFRVDFANYANGELSTVGVPFDLFYTGTGTGYQEISSGVSQWHKVTDGDRSVIGIYNGGVKVTDTDYQWLQATAAGAMGYSGSQSATNMFFARVNNAGSPTTAVYIKGYRTGAFGLGFKCELGCFVAGVQTVFVTNVSVTFSFTLGIKAGVGGNPYRFQVLSGNTVIIDYTDTAHVSQVGSGYRRWGWSGATANGGDATPGSGTYFQCTDNAPVAVTGTTFRAFRSLTASLSTSTGDIVLPANTFDTTDYKSSDLTWNPATNELTINTSGTYIGAMTLGFNEVAGMGATVWLPIWYKNGSIKHRGRMVKSVSINGFGVPATSIDNGVGGDPYVDYLLAGTVIKFGMSSTGSTTLNGDSTGVITNVAFAKVG